MENTIYIELLLDIHIKNQQKNIEINYSVLLLLIYFKRFAIASILSCLFTNVQCILFGSFDYGQGNVFWKIK